ncbi:Hypothetical predicted protein [Paramuricea clavata]|uniref:Uncharacterized protein n=1 Tax=Paramuricea clavata TaxID=317549 RepID=A0A7D9HJN4_PARCT|nr:Hypothetical predicted protein [Paramuricea clavata]
MGNKKSSGYAKKRKLSSNQFQNMVKKLRVSDQGETSKANTSASARKISARISTEHKESIKESVSGFRLVNMEILKDIFELLPCSNCQKFNLEFLEDNDNRMECGGPIFNNLSAKTVCEKTIEDAAKEIHDIKQKTSNEVVDCAVSCDVAVGKGEGFSTLNVSRQFPWIPGKFWTESRSAKCVTHPKTLETAAKPEDLVTSSTSRQTAETRPCTFGEAPFGMQTGRIQDSQITASSIHDPTLSTTKGRLNSATSWSARQNNLSQWIQVDLGREEVVTSIGTQGRGDYPQWVETYSVSYGSNGNTFEPYKIDGVVKVRNNNWSF